MDHGPWTSLMVLPRYTPKFVNIHQTTLMVLNADNANRNLRM